MFGVLSRQEFIDDDFGLFFTVPSTNEELLKPVISIKNDEGIIIENWFINGHESIDFKKCVLNRLDAPSLIKKNLKGEILGEAWCIDGSIIRLDGPAIIERNSEGEIINEKWYIENILYVSKYLDNGVYYYQFDDFNNDIYSYISTSLFNSI